MAPALGFEPRTKWLTATCSTAELRWIRQGWEGETDHLFRSWKDALDLNGHQVVFEDFSGWKKKSLVTPSAEGPRSRPG